MQARHILHRPVCSPLMPSYLSSRTKQRLAILALAAGLCVSWPSSTAYASIVIGQGIAGVRLGDTQAQATRRLGKPVSIVPPNLLYGRPLDGHIGLDFRQRVNDISTRSPAQKTNHGIGPHSPAHAVLHAYPHLRCYRHAITMLCLLTSRYHHLLVETDFFFKGHTLLEVDIFSRGT
jgi:hypothetical protein